MVKGGQRMVTCLLYLDEPEEGGATSFPNLDMEVIARKGRMLLFHNCHPNSIIRHPDSLHVGMSVLSGEKWACNFLVSRAGIPDGDCPHSQERLAVYTQV